MRKAFLVARTNDLLPQTTSCTVDRLMFQRSIMSSTRWTLILYLLWLVKVKAKTGGLCVSENNVYTVHVNLYAGELGYFWFEECSDLVNPTIGLEIGQSYTFIQYERDTWYHPLGFAYFPDGAHDGLPELEPTVTESTTSDCATTATCPAPMYFIRDEYQGTYCNIPELCDVTEGETDFGLDVYEPLFVHPLAEWMAIKPFKIMLRYDDDSYDKDLFYFCHVSQREYQFLVAFSNLMNCFIPYTFETDSQRHVRKNQTSQGRRASQ